VIGREATQALVIRAQRGDGAAFAALAGAFLRAAYAIALGVVRRPADAEDVAQEAFIVALERIDACREPAAFPGWLLTIVRNRAKNWVDRRRLRDGVDEDPPETAVAPIRPELVGLRERLLAALTVLLPVQREVVLLHDLEDWTHAEIGAALGMSEVMSRQHLFNARRVLRGRLADDALPEVDHERG
jgi:RNA polymerase sigma-70 factor (ECF subfamily)